MRLLHSLPLAAVLLASCGDALAQERVQVGSKPSYRFRSAPMFGAGVGSLEDLKGKPTILEFWGVKCGPCIGSAVPSAVRMMREHGDVLNTIFVESQGHTMDDVTKMALQRQWFGTDAVWTTERPVTTGARGIPNFVLLSPEGEVVMMGNPISMHHEIEEYVESFRRSRATMPETVHKKLKKAWKSQAKGEFADAVKAASKYLDHKDTELAAAAQAFVAETQAMATRKVEALGKEFGAGFYYGNDKRLENLAEELKGLEAEQLATQWLERLDSKELEDEIAAERDLVRLEMRLFSGRPDERMAAMVKSFLKDRAGTKAAARAQKYVGALR